MRLIDADKLLKCIPPEELCSRIAVAIAPTVEERKTGRWIPNSPVTMKCDQCELVIKDWDWHRFNFCPNCGAKMEGAEE